MPRTATPPGAPCWFELVLTDPAASTTFHHELFGWTSAGMDLGPMGTYSFLRNSNGTVSALCPLPPDAPPHSGWNVYFGVTDADACAARAAELGGKICVPAFDAPGVGPIARIDDPTGAGVYVIRLNRA